MKNYTCQCGRCDGSGRFDRGTCFECKGVGYVNRSTKPRGLSLCILIVTYSNGSTNEVKVYASSRDKAISIVERMIRIKGWIGTVV
jgi:DnaJ-class molecular chaperone